MSTSDPSIFTVTAHTASGELRRFSLHGRRQGTAWLLARVAGTRTVVAETRVLVGLSPFYRYYHGTSSAIADLLLEVDLTPMFLAALAAYALTRFDWID